MASPGPVAGLRRSHRVEGSLTRRGTARATLRVVARRHRLLEFVTGSLTTSSPTEAASEKPADRAAVGK